MEAQNKPTYPSIDLAKSRKLLLEQCQKEIAIKHGLGHSLVTGHRVGYFNEASELYLERALGTTPKKRPLWELGEDDETCIEIAKLLGWGDFCFHEWVEPENKYVAPHVMIYTDGSCLQIFLTGIMTLNVEDNESLGVYRHIPNNIQIGALISSKYEIK